MKNKVLPLAEAASWVHSGASISIGGFTSQRHPTALLRELIRQKVESFVEVAGLRFAAKESVTIEGRNSGEVTYGPIQVNPALTPGLFDFPSF